MDQFRRINSSEEEIKDHESTSGFTPASIIRDSSTSAFSKPILPSSASLLSPKPQFGAPLLNGSIRFTSTPDNQITPPSSTATTDATRYRECLRNHAANLGGHVVDGCGEFMPAGPADPLKCAACGCHRSFHRKEPEPDSAKYLVPLLASAPNQPTIVRFNGKSANASEYPSSSEERINAKAVMSNGSEGGTKRFRTKFSSEQKEKMKAFAERVGWRVQKKDEGEMDRFCRELGVSRQVLKVWMHNNKHLLRNKQDGHCEMREIKVEGLMQIAQQRPGQLHDQKVNGV